MRPDAEWIIGWGEIYPDPEWASGWGYGLIYPDFEGGSRRGFVFHYPDPESESVIGCGERYERRFKYSDLEWRDAGLHI